MYDGEKKEQKKKYNNNNIEQKFPRTAPWVMICWKALKPFSTNWNENDAMFKYKQKNP